MQEQVLQLTRTIIDVFIDVSLVVLPSAMFWRLQMPWKKKAEVTVAFSCRLM
jgi:hypothetical protein